MKKLFLIAVTSMATQISFGQQSLFPAVSVSNATQAGYVGIGTKSTTTTVNTPSPNFNLHLHGTADFTDVERGESTPINMGKTIRLGFTNTTTGLTANDGVVLRMSDNNFTIQNRENGNLSLYVPNVGMQFNNSLGRIDVGGSISAIPAECAKFNVNTGTNANGLYIHNTGTGNYGLSIRTAVNTNDAIRVMGADGGTNVKNFSVKVNGEVNTKDLFVNGTFRVRNSTNDNQFSIDPLGFVRAREILVDGLPIPDYVFKPDYKLMTLGEVEQFVTKFHHLPNVKSELEFQEAGGVQLGEMNLKLLEKIEELTLYVIDLQKQIDELKNK